MQIEYPLMSRGVEPAILPACRVTGAGDVRAHSPRFDGKNHARNRALAATLGAVAAELGLTGPRAAIAGVLSRGEDVAPVVGARRRDRLAGTLAAADARLTKEQVGRIDAAVPATAVAGERCAAHGMASLDSERAG